MPIGAVPERARPFQREPAAAAASSRRAAARSHARRGAEARAKAVLRQCHSDGTRSRFAPPGPRRSAGNGFLQVHRAAFPLPEVPSADRGSPSLRPVERHPIAGSLLQCQPICRTDSTSRLRSGLALAETPEHQTEVVLLSAQRSGARSRAAPPGPAGGPSLPQPVRQVPLSRSRASTARARGHLRHRPVELDQLAPLLLQCLSVRDDRPRQARRSTLPLADPEQRDTEAVLSAPSRAGVVSRVRSVRAS